LTRQSHSDYQELLGAYALGAVTPEEARDVAAHLVTCPACRDELAALQAAMHAIPLTVEDREPSPDLRNRILSAVANEPAPLPVAPPPAPSVLTAPPVSIAERRSRGGWAPWAAAAALLLIALGLLGWNLRLRDDGASNDRVIAVESTQPESALAAELRYLEESGVLLLTLDEAPSLAEGQVLQVWLIAGETPVSAGIFATGEREFAVAADPADYQLLAVTVESGPVGVPAPTSDPILIATLSSA
jgi:anti-sigma-K factor RskA